MATLRVVTFRPDWGLPAAGPFDLKLLAWLRLAGIPYEQRYQDDARKGPKGKSPWIEFDAERIGDTEIIIETLGRRFGIDLDAGLSDEQLAIGHAWRRSFEEHFHQVLEWELLIHPAGARYMRASLAKSLPPVARTLVWTMISRHMGKQLHARGIARHAPEVIEAKGRADLDALAAFLGDRAFLLTDRPTMLDCAVFGLTAPMLYWPMETPVAVHARSLPAVAGYCGRMRDRCFGAGAT